MSIGERVKSARIMAGMSQQDLASAAEISAMAISKYERDMDIPSSAVLIRLARALGVKIEYFFRSITVTLSAPTYRRRKSLPPTQEASILERTQEWLERYLDVETLLDLSPHYKIPFRQNILTMNDIEDAALQLRKEWDLGLDPIEGLMEVCEDRGIKIGLLDGHIAFDSLTLLANSTIPIIVLRRDMPGDRQRFCLAHELGHIFLEPTEDLDPEKVAHRFAGAFLVPRPVATFELGSQRHAISLYELHLLKHKYGLSMQAWIYRAKDLGILPTATANLMFKQFRQQKWHLEEPGDALPSEEPQRFKRLVSHALCEGIISSVRASELLGEPLSEFIGGEMARHGGLSLNSIYS
jgi:Zn-dependent peptidase ImmA (M78 family)/DNA-binding XRE family transcriptional regulator